MKRFWTSSLYVLSLLGALAAGAGWAAEPFTFVQLCDPQLGMGGYERDVRTFGNLPIPMNLRNAPTKLMKDEGYGTGYEMYPEEGTSLLPEKLQGKKYFGS